MLQPIVVKGEIAAGVLAGGEQLPGIVENFYPVTMAWRFPYTAAGASRSAKSLKPGLLAGSGGPAV